MDKVKILIVEDELVIAMNMTDILENLGYEVLETAVNYEEAIEFLNEEEPDLAILDIQLEGTKTGIDVADYIQSKHKIPFIFLTSNSGKATIEKAKKVNPSAFLIKPFISEDLFAAIEIAMHNFQKQSQESKKEESPFFRGDALFVKEKNNFHKVKLNDITFLKSDHVYIEINTLNKGKFNIRGSFNEIAENLTKQFFRVHRSYMINLDHLESIKSSSVIIENAEVPLSKSHREELLKIISAG